MKLTKRRGNSGSVDTLRRDMDLFFDDLMPFSWSRDIGSKALREWTPSADISEDENEYVILMDIPGIQKDGIKVNYQDKRVTITGERKNEEKIEENDLKVVFTDHLHLLRLLKRIRFMPLLKMVY